MGSLGSPKNSWNVWALLDLGGRLHALDQIVEIGAGHRRLFRTEQHQGRILHGAHGFNHARHGNAETVVHLTGAHQADLLDQFRAASEHPIGDEPEVPAVVPQALGPLLLAIGIAARGHVVGLAGEELLRRFIDNLFFVVGENPDNGEPEGSSAQVLDHRAKLTAARITKLIVCLEDQIPNDAHRSDHIQVALYRLEGVKLVPS